MFRLSVMCSLWVKPISSSICVHWQLCIPDPSSVLGTQTLRHTSKACPHRDFVFYTSRNGNIFFSVLFIPLFILERAGAGGEKETSIHCLPHRALTQDRIQQPRHVPCPGMGIKPVSLWCMEWHSVNWATLARALFFILKQNICLLFLECFILF